ncbi:MAG: WG repeat-containing protein [Acidobacteriota bacterium]
MEPRFDWLDGFSEGLASMNLGMAWHGHQKSGGKCGFIDKSGSIVIPVKYDVANSFSEGLAPVSINGKWGFIDKTGVMKITPRYDWAEPFESGISKVTLGEKIGYINTIGNYIWKPSE